MATNTFVLLDEVTLSSSSSSIQLSGLDSLTDYRDLYITLEGKVASGGPYYAYVTTSPNPNNADSTWFKGENNSVGAGGANNNKIELGTSSYFDTTNVVSVTFEVFDFLKTDRYKNFIYQISKANGVAEFAVGTSRTTSALTAINFTMNVGSWATGAQLKMWGIAG